jgi:uncharacterized BrkB/YihY/UPF0761 family membrane protein
MCSLKNDLLLKLDVLSTDPCPQHAIQCTLFKIFSHCKPLSTFFLAFFSLILDEKDDTLTTVSPLGCIVGDYSI